MWKIREASQGIEAPKTAHLIGLATETRHSDPRPICAGPLWSSQDSFLERVRGDSRFDSLTRTTEYIFAVGIESQIP